MRDVDISPDGTKAVRRQRRPLLLPRLRLAERVPDGSAPSTNVQPLWTEKIGDTMEAVAADRDTVYISGHFRYLETETHTQPRFQIAARRRRRPARGSTGSPTPAASAACSRSSSSRPGCSPAATATRSAWSTTGATRSGPTPPRHRGPQDRRTGPWVLAPVGHGHRQVRVQNTFTDRSVTLTALSDTRLGNLDGSGHLHAAADARGRRVYSCTTASETVSGAAPTDVSAAPSPRRPTPAARTVTDTDTSDVQVIATAPVFRLRAVVGPGRSPSPGETVRFSVTMMNLDLERSTTMTSSPARVRRPVERVRAARRCVAPNQTRSTATWTGSSPARSGPSRRSPSRRRRTTTPAP